MSSRAGATHSPLLSSPAQGRVISIVHCSEDVENLVNSRKPHRSTALRTVSCTILLITCHYFVSIYNIIPSRKRNPIKIQSVALLRLLPAPGQGKVVPKLTLIRKKKSLCICIAFQDKEAF